jgi:exonuclease SbcC
MKLTLEGFLGFATQGKPRVTLDLSGLVDDARLVAITGPNGAGKTTIMDNLHPFRVMPSRWGSPTPGGGSYWDQVQQPGEARKEFEFEHQGELYRSILTFRSTAKTKKAEAYLLRQEGQDWIPVRAPDGVESDGKTDTYDAALEGILGKPEVFFRSVFSAQSRTPLSDMSAGEVKALLSGMLGHEALREQSARAAKVAALLNASLTTLQASARSREADDSAARAARQRLETATSQVTACDADIVRRDAEVQAAVDALTQAQVKASGEQALVTQRKVLTERIAQIQSDADATIKQMEQAGATALRGMMERMTQSQGALAALRKDLAGAQAQVKLSDQRLAQEAAIRQAVVDLATLDRDIQSMSERKAQLDAPIQSARQAAADLAKIAAEMGSSKASGKALAEKVAQVRGTCAIMDKVPCAGTDLQGQCPLLDQARQSKAGLAPLEKQLVDMRASYRQMLEQHTERAKAAERGTALQADADALQKQIDSAQQRRRQLAALAAQIDGLDRERQVRHDAMERVTKIQSSIAESEQSLQSIQAEIERERERQGREIVQAREQASKRLGEAQKALSELPDAQAAHAVQQAEVALATARQAATLARTTRERAAGELRQAQADAERAIAKALESAKAASRAQALSDEIAHWALLAKALGNDGLIALSIDDAGPEIAARCNALLDECYGGRFAVSIETQKAAANGELRETLEIWVEDTARGDRKPLDLLSGGEGVWVNESLVRGLALYIASRSGNSYATLFTDEADGALDPERKRQFMRMKRTVLEQGGFEREFFISHTPELLEMADARIDVAAL